MLLEIFFALLQFSQQNKNQALLWWGSTIRGLRRENGVTKRLLDWEAGKEMFLLRNSEK